MDPSRIDHNTSRLFLRLIGEYLYDDITYTFTFMYSIAHAAQDSALAEISFFPFIIGP